MNELCSIVEIPSGPLMRCCEVMYEGSLMMVLPYHEEGATAYLTVSEVHALHTILDDIAIEELNKQL